MEHEQKSSSKPRSRAQKIGRHKWNQELLKRALKEIQEIKLMQRTILAGLKGMFHFEKPMIQKIACIDDVDCEILELLRESGSGMLPRDLAARLGQFKVRRHQVSRRIVRMNKRVAAELGEKLVEKRGWHWALTTWAFDVWGEDEKDLKEASESEG